MPRRRSRPGRSATPSRSSGRSGWWPRSAPRASTTTRRCRWRCARSARCCEGRAARAVASGRSRWPSRRHFALACSPARVGDEEQADVEYAGQEERGGAREKATGNPGNHDRKLKVAIVPNAQMADSVSTTVTELPESRVRVQAEVAPEEVERRVQQAARELGRQMRVPGFRKGKVPPTVVIRRLGREAVLDEAVRSALGSWYADAIDGAGIAPVGEPELDMSDLPGQGKPLEFSIEIGVRPKAKLGEYKGVEVGRREPKVE